MWLPDLWGKKTIKEFVNDANLVHNNKYDYSKFEYVNNLTNGIIICPIHGEFYQLPINHLAGSGCLSCGIQAAREKKLKSLSEVIKESNKSHNNKYDYSKVKYEGAFVKILIICPLHGEFKQTPHNHIFGHGCPKCGRIEANQKLTKSTNEFIEQARKVHGDKYDYSKVNYIGSFDKITIICPKHGKFKQSPANHLNGNNCLSCSRSTVSKISQLWLDMLGIHHKYREKVIIVEKNKYILDAFVPETKTAYEFYGDYWHGNPNKYNKDDFNSQKNKSFGQLYQETLDREKIIRTAGYKLISIWEGDFINID